MPARNGQVMGFDEDTLKRISAAVATWEFKDENDALDRRLRDAGLDLSIRGSANISSCASLRKIFRATWASTPVHGHLRGASRFGRAAGARFHARPMVVQWDKEDCADMGIIKVDLLGLGMMAALKDSLELIRDHYREEWTWRIFPPTTPSSIPHCKRRHGGNVSGREPRADGCLPRLKPQKFLRHRGAGGDHTARPIVGNMVNPFLKRRQGREAVIYPHPSLETVLAAAGRAAISGAVAAHAMIAATSPAAKPRSCAAPWASSVPRCA